MKKNLFKVLVLIFFACNSILSMEDKAPDENDLSNVGHLLKLSCKVLVKGNENSEENALHLKCINEVIENKKEQFQDEFADLLVKYHSVINLFHSEFSQLYPTLKIELKMFQKLVENDISEKKHHGEIIYSPSYVLKKLTCAEDVRRQGQFERRLEAIAARLAVGLKRELLPHINQPNEEQLLLTVYIEFFMTKEKQYNFYIPSKFSMLTDSTRNWFYNLGCDFSGLIKGEKDQEENAEHLRFIDAILQTKKKRFQTELANLVMKNRNIIAISPAPSETKATLKIQLRMIKKREHNDADMNAVPFDCIYDPQYIVKQLTSLEEIKQHDQFYNELLEIVGRLIDESVDLLPHINVPEEDPLFVLDLSLFILKEEEFNHLFNKKES